MHNFSVSARVDFACLTPKGSFQAGIHEIRNAFLTPSWDILKISRFIEGVMRLLWLPGLFLTTIKLTGRCVIGTIKQTNTDIPEIPVLPIIAKFDSQMSHVERRIAQEKMHQQQDVRKQIIAHQKALLPEMSARQIIDAIGCSKMAISLLYDLSFNELRFVLEEIKLEDLVADSPINQIIKQLLKTTNKEPIENYCKILRPEVFAQCAQVINPEVAYRIADKLPHVFKISYTKALAKSFLDLRFIPAQNSDYENAIISNIPMEMRELFKTTYIQLLRTRVEENRYKSDPSAKLITLSKEENWLAIDYISEILTSEVFAHINAARNPEEVLRLIQSLPEENQEEYLLAYEEMLLDWVATHARGGKRTSALDDVNAYFYPLKRLIINIGDFSGSALAHILLHHTNNSNLSKILKIMDKDLHTWPGHIQCDIAREIFTHKDFTEEHKSKLSRQITVTNHTEPLIPVEYRCYIHQRTSFSA